LESYFTHGGKRRDMILMAATPNIAPTGDNDADRAARCRPKCPNSLRVVAPCRGFRWEENAWDYPAEWLRGDVTCPVVAGKVDTSEALAALPAKIPRLHMTVLRSTTAQTLLWIAEGV
jgi:hypothetical protein